MSKSDDYNFAARLVQRLGERSYLADAATGQTLRGGEIANSIVGFADGFLSAGLQGGDRLLISCGVNPASAVAYLGAMYGGLTPVPVDERTLNVTGESLFIKSHAKALWAAKPVRCDWAQRGGVPRFFGNFSPPVCWLPPAAVDEDDLAALMSTSGSTGAPRLVMVSHGNLLANTEAIIRSQGLESNDRAMLVMPVSYCFGASVLHTHLYQGGGVVFDSRFMFPDKVLHMINAHGCTTFAGVPTVYNILLRRSSLKSIPLPGLRRFLQAGGALAPERTTQIRGIVPQAEFFVMYGQTEATARISCLPPHRLNEKLGSAGLPLDNVVIRIVDEQERELPCGQPGEIQVRGPSVCSGYLDDPEATERKFSGRWLRTGDLAFRDDEGYLWMRGRLSEFIKIRGVRVSFSEVETSLAAIPGIHECAATAVPHPEAGEALALFIVPDNGTTGIVEAVRRRLPPQWTCASLRLVPELPKTPNGKIARHSLQGIA